MAEQTQSCATCRFHQPDEKYNGDGNCRRFPPQMMAYSTLDSQGIIETHYPWMRASDWCGEYQPEPQQ